MSQAAACSSCRSSAVVGRRAAFLPVQRPAACRLRRQRRVVAPAAALDTAQITAVTQQAVAYVAVLGGEAAFTGLSTDPATPGRPTVPQTLGGAAATLAAVALVQQDGFLGTVGCAVGALAGAAMLSVMIRRVQTTPYDPADWPGAKSWPAVMALISFFSLMVFFQALSAALN